MKMRELCKYLFDIEKKYDLFNYKINGIYFWKLIRIKVFKQITNKTNIYTSEKGSSGLQGFFNDIIKELYMVKYSAMRLSPKSHIMVVKHNRRVMYQNQLIDPYTWNISNFLNKQNIVDISYVQVKYSQNSFNVNDDLHFAFPSGLNRFMTRKRNKVSLTNDDIQLLQNLEKEFKHSFNVNIDLMKKTNSALSNFVVLYSYYNKLFKKKGTKQLYIVCSYAKEAIISAAKNNNVVVTEIQHGSMSIYHMGYSFPYNRKIHYFPDRLMMFGEFWSDITPLPIDQKNIIYYGYPFFEKQLSHYKSNKRQDKSVLFISQWSITQKIVKIAYDFARQNKDYSINFKLHPLEYNDWKLEYPLLKLANELDNFVVIDNSDYSIHYYQSKSEYQVGVYSTAIYEGLAMELKTTLLSLSGIDNMDFLVDKRLVKVAKNDNELLICLKDFDNHDSKLDGDYFFNITN